MSPYNNLGKSVSSYRMAAATKEVNSMLPNISKWDRDKLIGLFKTNIESDNPNYLVGNPSIHDGALNLLDLTGRYRLLACMLAAEKPRIRLKLKPNKI